MTVLLSIIGALAYCLTSFSKKHNAGQSWDWSKFISTMIIAGIVGFIARETPLSKMTEQWVVAQIASYAGAVAVIENVIKFIWRLIRKKR